MPTIFKMRGSLSVTERRSVRLHPKTQQNFGVLKAVEAKTFSLPVSADLNCCHRPLGHCRVYICRRL